MEVNSSIEILGVCDCGVEYDAASRFDHDADAGLCWACSGRSIDEMSEDEREAYLLGA